MRKHYLDQLRSITIVLVVIFHCFFYYNNIGIKATFAGLPAYTEATHMTIAGVYQYAVYPWFMELLFVIAGMSSYYALQKRTDKAFMKERRRKLLVPSTLGVLCFGWLSGYILTNVSAGLSLDQAPEAVKVVIYFLSGIGALWFCQLLFVISLVLVGIRKLERKIDPNGQFRALCEKSNLIVIVLLFLPAWGSSQLLNMPMITCYRFGIYCFDFLLGYYVFASEKVQEVCEKWAWLLLGGAVCSGIYYIYRSYGTYYADIVLLNTWYSSLFGYLMVPALLGIGRRYLNFTNKFMEEMKKESFGIYVIHITVLVITGYLLSLVEIPIVVRYVCLAAIGLGGSYLLSKVIKRIPVIRYIILGIHKEK